MSATDAAFLAFLDAQRADYRHALPQRVAQIELLWQQVLNGDCFAQALATLERCAHSLAGSGATFGFASMGSAARQLELAVTPLLDAEFAVVAAAQPDICQAIEALKSSLP